MLADSHNNVNRKRLVVGAILLLFVSLCLLCLCFMVLMFTESDYPAFLDDLTNTTPTSLTRPDTTVNPTSYLQPTQIKILMRWTQQY